MSVFQLETTETTSCPAKPTLSRTMSVDVRDEPPAFTRPTLSRTMSVNVHEETPAFAKPSLSRTMSVNVHDEEPPVFARPVLSRTMSVDVRDEPPAFARPTLSRTMSVRVREDEYTLSNPAMTRTYALGAGACNDPLNGGEPSELEKIVNKKMALQIEEEEEEEEEEEKEEPCEDCMAIDGGYIEGCDTCGIYRYSKGQWWKPLKGDLQENRVDVEEEEGIGCNECYACVTGGSTPCLQDVNIERDP
jgi:hypothetical protein